MLYKLKSFVHLVLEATGETFFWMTNGPYHGSDPIGQHVPKAKMPDNDLEQQFEQARLRIDPSLPSRLNCVFLCNNIDGLSGQSFCSPDPEDDVFIVKLKGQYSIHETDAMIYTEAAVRHRRGHEYKHYIDGYWEPANYPNSREFLVSPPSAAIIVDKLKR